MVTRDSGCVHTEHSLLRKSPSFKIRGFDLEAYASLYVSHLRLRTTKISKWKYYVIVVSMNVARDFCIESPQGCHVTVRDLDRNAESIIPNLRKGLLKNILELGAFPVPEASSFSQSV